MAVRGFGQMVNFDNEGKIYLDRFQQIQFSADVQNRDVDGYPFDNPDGVLQIVDSFITREQFDVQLSTGSFDEVAISRIFDQQISREDVTLPLAKTYQLDGTGNVAIPDLVADQEAGAFFPSETNPLQYTQVVAPPAAANEFQVLDGEVHFDPSQAERTVIFNYFKTYTQLKTIGVTSNPVGALGFTGRIIGPRFDIGPQFYIPRMNRVSGFQFGGDTNQITYRASIQDPFARAIIFAFDVPE